MSLLKNPNEEIINNTVKLIDRLTELATSKNYVYRGYGKNDELYPNLIRDKDWKSEETRFLYEFERYGLQYFSANSAIEFMSQAQHYGLPTRLLDFTYNPFIALSFALYMPKSNNYKDPDNRDYYYIRYCDLKDNILLKNLPIKIEQNGYFASNSITKKCVSTLNTINQIVKIKNEKANSLCGIKEYFESDIDNIEVYERPLLVGMKDIKFSQKTNEIANMNAKKFNAGKLLFVSPNQSNQRVVMQQGLFMFPYTLDKEEHTKMLIENTKVIKISKHIRGELLEYLDTIGMNAFRLMPDLPSVCEAIKRKVAEERKGKSILFKSEKKSVPAVDVLMSCLESDRFNFNTINGSLKDEDMDIFKDIIKELPRKEITNQIYYRGREILANESEEVGVVYEGTKPVTGYKEEYSGVTPIKYIKQDGRANRIGEQVLYLAEDIETAVKELKVENDSYISVAECKVDGPIHVIDFTVPVEESNFDNLFRLEVQNTFHEKYSMSIHTFYIAIKYYLTLENYRKHNYAVPLKFLDLIKKIEDISGIQYQSSYTNRNNVALWDDNKFLECNNSIVVTNNQFTNA